MTIIVNKWIMMKWIVRFCWALSLFPLWRAPSVQAELVAGQRSAVSNSPSNRQCRPSKSWVRAQDIDDVEDLELDVPVNMAFDARKRKRFVLYLNVTTPLTIAFSQNVAKKIYYNETANLLRSVRASQRNVLLSCALRGQYDLFVQAKQRGSIKIEAHAGHPQESWPLLNRTHHVSIRSQHRVRKRQMTVKWDKSKFDFHAVHYCLVVSTQHPNQHFCAAVEEYLTQRSDISCLTSAATDYVWAQPSERHWKIDPRHTNVICTGSRTQQLLKGLEVNRSYYLDVFGVHTKKQNLTFHMAGTRVHFNRTQPTPLRANVLVPVKISGLHGVQVYSYKVPSKQITLLSPLDYRSAVPAPQLRYLIVPCGGSEVNATIRRQRKVIGNIGNIYQPTYVRLTEVKEGQRFIIRFKPSNVDEKLLANKVGLAVTPGRVFHHLPELPENITVVEIRTSCTSTTIAWYSSPEVRTMSYCVIVLNLPQPNRSSVDYTNYCMDFGKRVMEHPLFHSIKCIEKDKSQPPVETLEILNLMPGEMYLIYVTANLSEGRPLPYQSLKVKMNQQCHSIDSRELNSYYY